MGLACRAVLVRSVPDVEPVEIVRVVTFKVINRTSVVVRCGISQRILLVCIEHSDFTEKIRIRIAC